MGFHRADIPTSYSGGTAWQEPPFQSGEMLSLVATSILIALIERKATSTVVGVDSLTGPWPGWRENEAGTLQSQVCDDAYDPTHRFLALCEECSFWEARPDLDPAQVLGDLKFMTLDEFRDSVRPERAGIETRESGCLTA